MNSFRARFTTSARCAVRSISGCSARTTVLSTRLRCATYSSRTFTFSAASWMSCSSAAGGGTATTSGRRPVLQHSLKASSVSQGGRSPSSDEVKTSHSVVVIRASSDLAVAVTAASQLDPKPRTTPTRALRRRRSAYKAARFACEYPIALNRPKTPPGCEGDGGGGAGGAGG